MDTIGEKHRAFNVYAAAVEAAKNIGNLEVANDMFSAALNICWQADDSRVSRIYIESLTTPDSEEYATPGDSYYDLIHLYNDEFDICIPSPLLDSLIALSCYRGAEVRPRLGHSRLVRDDDEARDAYTSALKDVEDMEDELGSWTMRHWIIPES